MDDASKKPRIAEVPVKAHGPFAFSRLYDDGQVQERTMAATVWNMTFGTLPILPAWAVKLNEDLIVRSIFGTAAIEGSPLTEPEVSALLAAQPKPARESEKERVILNLREAYQLAGNKMGGGIGHNEWVGDRRVRPGGHIGGGRSNVDPKPGHGESVVPRFNSQGPSTRLEEVNGKALYQSGDDSGRQRGQVDYLGSRLGALCDIYRQRVTDINVGATAQGVSNTLPDIHSYPTLSSLEKSILSRAFARAQSECSGHIPRRTTSTLIVKPIIVAIVPHLRHFQRPS